MKSFAETQKYTEDGQLLDYPIKSVDVHFNNQDVILHYREGQRCMPTTALMGILQSYKRLRGVDGGETPIVHIVETTPNKVTCNGNFLQIIAFLHSSKLISDRLCTDLATDFAGKAIKEISNALNNSCREEFHRAIFDDKGDAPNLGRKLSN